MLPTNANVALFLVNAAQGSPKNHPRAARSREKGEAQPQRKEEYEKPVGNTKHRRGEARRCARRMRCAAGRALAKSELISLRKQDCKKELEEVEKITC